MRSVHESWGAPRQRHPDYHPYPFHPEPGGLISFGYDYSGDEPFFWPCDPNPQGWKVVTMVHEIGVEVSTARSPASYSPSSTGCAAWSGSTDLPPTPLEFLEPEDLDELADNDEEVVPDLLEAAVLGPVRPEE